MIHLYHVDKTRQSVTANEYYERLNKIISSKKEQISLTQKKVL